MVRMFRIVSQNGDTEYWITNNLEATEAKRKNIQDKCWRIEMYHRGLKQACNVEHFQVRKEHSIRSHIQFAIRAFLRLEKNRIKTLTSWYEATTAILRGAITLYLTHPLYILT